MDVAVATASTAATAVATAAGWYSSYGTMARCTGICVVKYLPYVAHRCFASHNLLRDL